MDEPIPIPDARTIAVRDDAPRLVYNDTDRNLRVLTTITSELRRCDEFLFSVAFVTGGGLSCLRQHLLNASGRIRGRIITTDYLNFNDPRALRDLLRIPGVETRMYTKTNFHTKGYLFRSPGRSVLLVGSSNLTQGALNMNKEWNVRMTSSDGDPILADTEAEFERMWADSTPLTEQWIADYEPVHIRARIARDREIFVDDRHPDVIKPNMMQEEALVSLSRLRSSGASKALLISATGTGKTFLSAFDVKESGARRVLFLVHREQILDKAMESYRSILGNVSMGKISGSCKDYDADMVFSTVASMTKADVRSHFAPDHFEYIVCDEAHHGTSETYRRIMEYYRPRFLLGMTATPERMDSGDVFALFDHNIAYEIRLQDALREEMLCPFHYYGISDIEVDGRPLEEGDFKSLVCEERVGHIIDKCSLYGFSGDRVRGLMFVSRRDEGTSLSESLNSHGLRTIFLSGDDTPARRNTAVDRLEAPDGPDALDYIITVDIFNEGVDIRSVNQVVMLRPTESATVFIQQLGRGLRRFDTGPWRKEYLVVIDFIGNYRNNFMIPVALTGDGSMNRESLRRHLMMDNDGIPGCSTVDFDLVSRERIYESINRTKDLLKMVKDTYRSLTAMLGYCPDLCYLYDNGKIDPRVIVGKYHSLNGFRRTLKLDHRDFTDEGERVLTFVSENLIDGMRPHELLLLKGVIERGSIDVERFGEDLSAYGVDFDAQSLDSAVSMLRGTFCDGLDGGSLLEASTDGFIRGPMLDGCLSEEGLREEIMDVVECGLRTFSREYADGFEDGLTPFKRYSRADTVRLLNWSSRGESSTMYGYRVKNGTCPMFVTYHKDDSISMSTRYEDRFIDRSTFSWMTRSRITLDSSEVVRILDPECRCHLFVKKDDDESSDFYYMGRAYPILPDVRQTTIMDDKGRELPIVNIPLRLRQPVPEDIYRYIVGA